MTSLTRSMHLTEARLLRRGDYIRPTKTTVELLYELENTTYQVQHVIHRSKTVSFYLVGVGGPYPYSCFAFVGRVPSV